MKNIISDDLLGKWTEISRVLKLGEAENLSSEDQEIIANFAMFVRFAATEGYRYPQDEEIPRFMAATELMMTMLSMNQTLHDCIAHYKNARENGGPVDAEVLGIVTQAYRVIETLVWG